MRSPGPATPPSVPPAAAADFSFGAYALDRLQGVLLRNGSPVPLGPRAMQLLVLLTGAPGRVMDARELAQHLWPGRTVDESGLRLQVAAVRKALDDADGRLLVNVRGRGYYFVPPSQPPAHPPADASGAPRHRTPPSPPALIGRTPDLDRLMPALRTQRVVTLVGAGGVGKTALALSAVSLLADDFPAGICFVDLSRVGGDRGVPMAVALAFGLSSTGENPLPLLRRHLSAQRWLLLLDNCEHVAAGVKALVALLEGHVLATHFLMTSREALGVAGEAVFRLEPLRTAEAAASAPVAARPLSEAAALFVERARAVAGEAPFDAAALSLVEQICVNLDGLPLAIEIAAAQTAGLGIPALAQRTGNLVRLLSRGRPGWPERHRTLVDLLDWSCSLLQDEQRALLCQLAVFRGSFLRAEVRELAAGMGLSDEVTGQALDALIQASMVTAAPPNGPLRLLFTTRSYAENKLAESGQARLAWQRRAAQLTAQLLRANEALEQATESDLPAWHGRHADRMVEVGACLDAVLANGADPRVVLELCLAAGPSVLEFALFAEFRPRLAQALNLLPRLEPTDDELTLRLHALTCFVGLVASKQPGEYAATLERTLDLANQGGSRDARINAVYGLCAHAASRADYPAMIALSLRLRELAGDDKHPAWHLTGRRFHAQARLHLGFLDEAQQVFEDFRDHPWPLVARHYLGHTPLAVQVCTWLARLQFLRSRSAEALRLAEQGLHAVDNRYSPIGITALLPLVVIPIAICRGEHERALEHVERLERHTAEHSVLHWMPAAAIYRTLLEHRRRGEPIDVERLPAMSPQLSDLLATVDEALITPASVERVRHGAVGWNAAAVLCADAMQRWRRGMDDPTVLPALREAQALAHRQGALAWSLRGAVNLAEVLGARGEHAAAALALGEELARQPPADGSIERLHAERAHARLLARLASSTASGQPEVW